MITNKLDFCRVCLSSSENTKLTSLFENGKNVEKFEAVSGIEISSDKNDRDALICFNCVTRIEIAFGVREQIRNSDQFYFSKFKNKDENQQEPLNKHEEKNLSSEDHLEIDVLIHELIEEAFQRDQNKALEAKPSIVTNLNEPIHRELVGKKILNHQNLEFSEPIDSECQHNIVSSPEKNKEVVETLEDYTKAQALTCSICLKVFLSKNFLRRHIVKLHWEQRNSFCDICGKEFTKTRSLKQHILRYHMFTKDNTSNCNRPHRCRHDPCGKYFKTRDERGKHEKYHKGGMKPKAIKHVAVKCPSCHKILSSKYTLRRHNLLVHQNNCKFTCDLCAKVFNHKNNFIVHMNHIHIFKRSKSISKPAQLLPLQCPTCYKIASRADALRKHIETFHKKTLGCSYCPKAFNSKQELRLHSAKHDNISSVIRQFKCKNDSCGKLFRTKKNLRNHKKLHATS